MRIFVVTAFLAGVVSGFAQGTFQYTVELNGSNAVPANSSMGAASGQFTLNGQALTYGILTTTPMGSLRTSVEIHGPARPGENAVSLYTLASTPSPWPPANVFVGSVQISANQIADLNSGLWYLNFHTAGFPNGEIRGQIVPVPEPNIIALGCLGFGLALLFHRRRRK